MTIEAVHLRKHGLVKEVVDLTPEIEAVLVFDANARNEESGIEDKRIDVIRKDSSRPSSPSLVLEISEDPEYRGFFSKSKFAIAKDHDIIAITNVTGEEIGLLKEEGINLANLTDVIDKNLSWQWRPTKTSQTD